VRAEGLRHRGQGGPPGEVVALAPQDRDIVRTGQGEGAQCGGQQGGLADTGLAFNQYRTAVAGAQARQRRAELGPLGVSPDNGRHRSLNQASPESVGSDWARRSPAMNQTDMKLSDTYREQFRGAADHQGRHQQARPVLSDASWLVRSGNRS